MPSKNMYLKGNKYAWGVTKPKWVPQTEFFQLPMPLVWIELKLRQTFVCFSGVWGTNKPWRCVYYINLRSHFWIFCHEMVKKIKIKITILPFQLMGNCFSQWWYYNGVLWGLFGNCTVNSNETPYRVLMESQPKEKKQKQKGKKKKNSRAFNVQLFISIFFL